MLIMVSCSSHTKQTRKKFKWPRYSFVKVEHRIFTATCTPIDPDDIYSKCYTSESAGNGSGAIVSRSKNGSYIITAGHVCDKSGVTPKLHTNIYSIDAREKRVFYVYDLDHYKYHAEILSYDIEDDLCLMYAWGLFGKPLKISKKGPLPGDAVYNIAAPGGIFQRGTVPLFEGRFSGEYNHYVHGKKFLYTIPVMSGASGSPILNKKGALIGIVSAGNLRFHHIMLGTRYSDTVAFITHQIKADIRKRLGTIEKNYLIFR
jgi:S1-C subfamily serine protease